MWIPFPKFLLLSLGCSYPRLKVFGTVWGLRLLDDLRCFGSDLGLHCHPHGICITGGNKQIRTMETGNRIQNHVLQYLFFSENRRDFQTILKPWTVPTISHCENQMIRIQRGWWEKDATVEGYLHNLRFPVEPQSPWSLNSCLGVIS